MARRLRSLVLLACVIFGLLYVLGRLYQCKNQLHFTELSFVFDNTNITRKCTLRRSELRSLSLNMSERIELRDVIKANLEVESGGRWSPRDCESWQKVAIVIPYRDREHHLTILLNRLHPMLRKQKISYQIFVVEQLGTEIFNKGRLYNAGFLEANKLDDFDCFVMHLKQYRNDNISLLRGTEEDVDLLPETDDNIYMCDSQGRHLSSAVNELSYSLPYRYLFGGVIAISKGNYERVNGYPNRYNGWGGEDDDMAVRTLNSGLILTRPPYNVGRYTMIQHTKSARSPTANDNIFEWRYWWKIDGLSNMKDIRYRVVSVKKHQLYTKILVDVGVPSSIPTINIPRESTFWFNNFFLRCPDIFL